MRLSVLTLGILIFLLVTVVPSTDSKWHRKNTANVLIGTDDKFLDGAPKYRKNVADAKVGTDLGSFDGRPLCGGKHGMLKGKGCKDDKKKKKKKRKDKKKKKGRKYKKDRFLGYEDTNYAALL